MQVQVAFEQFLLGMEEKTLLINSMEKLINHIVVSRKNQEEIFASLSRNDFKKIISNLEDENQRLRKISLALISQLLYNNPALKEKFCHIMNIPLLPGRVALNSKLCASAGRSKNNIAVDMGKNIKEVFGLLKQPIYDQERQSLFWFINYETRGQNLKLQFTNTSNPQSINIQQLLDPIDSMIGFVLHDRHSKSSEGHLNQPQIQPQGNPVERRSKNQHDHAPTPPQQGNRMVNNYFKPNIYKPEQIKYGQQSVNLNQSLNLNSNGYTTDRDAGKLGPSIKAVNASLYQEHTSIYPKPSHEINSPALHQFKNNPVDLENMNRAKFTGIKLISNTASVKNREPTKYFEQNPMFAPQTVNNSGSKVVSYIPNSGGKSLNLGQRVQRGYETLREKKIIEKYPV